MPGKVERSPRTCGVDQSSYRGDTVGGNAYAPGMLSDGRIVRSEIDAVDLVAGYVAMEPLDRGAHCLQNID